MKSIRKIIYQEINPLWSNLMTESMDGMCVILWTDIDNYLWEGVGESVESSGCLNLNPSQS